MNTERTCAIHQPNLFPRPATLAKILAADVWVVLDDVQHNHRDYQHRARLASIDGEHQQQWLSLSVHRPNGRATLITDARLIDQRTNARRVTKLIEQYYRRAPHWRLVHDLVTAVANVIQATDRLAEITELSTRLMLDVLGWRGETIRSSTVLTRPGRSTRLADLANAVDATEYLCGRGGATYLDERPFAEHGIHVRYLDAPPGSDGRISALRHLALTGSPQNHRAHLSESCFIRS